MLPLTPGESLVLVQGEYLLFLHLLNLPSLLFWLSYYFFLSFDGTTSSFPSAPAWSFLSCPLIQHYFLALLLELSDKAPVLPLLALFLSLFFLLTVRHSTITSLTSLNTLSSCLFFTQHHFLYFLHEFPSFSSLCLTRPPFLPLFLQFQSCLTLFVFISWSI